MSPSLRRTILFGALATSLVAAFLVRGEDQGAAEPAALPARPPERAAEPTAPAVPELALERLGRREPAESEGDPFRSKSWYVPPPLPPPEPPPKPTAPPLPFQYVGKFEEVTGGKVVIYFAKGSESFAASPGDKLDTNYRFEGIERGQAVFVYLPLAIKQRLSLGVSE